MEFNRTYSNWVMHNKEHLIIREVETHGKDLEDFLANAKVYIETWHGGEGPDYSVDDLPSKDYDKIVKEFTKYLNKEEV